jgi:Lsr2
MAKETIIKFTDDIDGTEAAETVSFSFRGTQYEIDLGEKNVTAFEKALSKYVAKARASGSGAAKRAVAAKPRTKARKATGGRRPRKASASKAAAAPTLTIREWAQANGYSVGTRGRIPAAAREAYEASVG